MEMKKIKIVLIFIAFILMFFITNNVFAAEEETKTITNINTKLFFIVKPHFSPSCYKFRGYEKQLPC